MQQEKVLFIYVILVVCVCVYACAYSKWTTLLQNFLFHAYVKRVRNFLYFVWSSKRRTLFFYFGWNVGFSVSKCHKTWRSTISNEFRNANGGDMYFKHPANVGCTRCMSMWLIFAFIWHGAKSSMVSLSLKTLSKSLISHDFVSPRPLIYKPVCISIAAKSFQKQLLNSNVDSITSRYFSLPALLAQWHNCVQFGGK